MVSYHILKETLKLKERVLERLDLSSEELLLFQKGNSKRRSY